MDEKVMTGVRVKAWQVVEAGVYVGSLALFGVSSLTSASWALVPHVLAGIVLVLFCWRLGNSSVRWFDVGTRMIVVVAPLLLVVLKPAMPAMSIVVNVIVATIAALVVIQCLMRELGKRQAMISELSARLEKHEAIADELHRRATHDALTGLPNRLSLSEKVVDLITDRTSSLAFIEDLHKVITAG